MSFRLTRKGFILVVLLLFVLVGGGVGYVMWRVNQQDKLIAEEADAGSGSGGSCEDTCSCMVCVNGAGDKVRNGTCTVSELARGYKAESNCGKHGGVVRITGEDYGGGWIMSTKRGTADACGSCGWSKTPVENPGTQTDCSCESHTNSDGRKCGVNCKFPAGTQAKVDAKAKETGKAYIAMCRSGGILVIEEFTSNHVCQGLTHICKNPVGNPPSTPPPTTTTNVCEGGGLITQAPSEPLEVGETLDVVGFAFDADGIDKSSFQVKVNGQTVGNVTSIDACPSGNTTVCSQQGTSKKPVVWTYKHTAGQEGDEKIDITWKDSLGNARAACGTSLTLTVEQEEVQTNPDWQLSKSGAGMCVDDNSENPSARINYTITVTNTGDGAGSIDKIVDTLDQKVLADYILAETVTPSANINGNIITWDLSGSDASFNVGESKTFKYSVSVPHQAFGTYTNNVIVTPVEGETFSDSATVQVDCTITPPTEETPETGIFGDTISKILVGLVLILAGIGYIYLDGRSEGTLHAIRGVNGRVSKSARVKRSRSKFEKRVVK